MKQFCLAGHDTRIIGRYKSGHCKICHGNTVKKWCSSNNYQAIWREKNVDKKRKLAHEWYIKNCEKTKRLVTEWKKRNPKNVYIYTKKSKLKRLKRVPIFGQDGIKDFYKNCPYRYEVDHINPLNGKLVSGLHVIWNLQYLTPEENKKKGNYQEI